MGFYTTDELDAIGLVHIGENVLISKKASLYNPSKISIGDNSRIDDFCILSAGDGGITIGHNVHIACYSSCIGAASIVLEDFCNLSGRVSIYSSSDDFSGAGLTNPTLPDQFRAVKDAEVFLGRHTIIGAGSVVLPGARLNEGVAIGAMSLVKGICEPYTIYAGNPIKKIGARKQKSMMKLEASFYKDQQR